MPKNPSGKHENGTARLSGELLIGDDFLVARLGLGTMRLTGKGIWGEPTDRSEAIRVVRRAVELGVNFIDTADSYGPDVSEEIIAEARQYIRDFDRLVETTTTARELYDQMLKLHPFRMNMGTLWSSARALKG